MRHTLFKYSTIILLVFLLFPPIWVYMPFSQALVLLLFVGFFIVLFPSLIKEKSIIFLFIYTFITLLLYYDGNDFYTPINAVVIPLLNVLSALLITGYAFKYNNVTYIKSIIFISFFLLVLISVISIPQVFISPNIIRGASISGARGDGLLEYYWVIGYGTIHGLATIFAPLVFFVKKSFKNNKFLFIILSIVTIVLYYIVYISNATTAILIATVGVGLGLTINFTNFSRKNVLKLLLLGVMFLLLFNKATVLMILDSVQPLLTEGGSNFKKISDIKDSIIFGETSGSVGARDVLYFQSKQLFFESPLFGTSKPHLIGEHSYFLDRLAALGIVFFIPLLLMFATHIKTVYKKLKYTKVVYVIGCGSYLLMLYLKNSFGSGSFLFAFAILPLLCIYIEDIINKQNKYGL